MSTDDTITARLAQLDEQGYCVIENAFDATQRERLREQLAPHLGRYRGRNDFEGFRSERVYALLAKAPVVAEMIEHPAVLPLVHEVLGPQPLLSAALAVNLLPGETRQTFHIDDGVGSAPLPRPRAALGVSTIWAIDPFTHDNGATEVVPGSHRWPADREPRAAEIEPVIMPAGAVLVFVGNLLHRGGANRSPAARLAVTPQYCAPWLRQIENMVLAVPPDLAGRYSRRLREMLGYSLFEPGFTGYVDGRHPDKLVTRNATKVCGEGTAMIKGVHTWAAAG